MYYSLRHYFKHIYGQNNKLGPLLSQRFCLYFQALESKIDLSPSHHVLFCRRPHRAIDTLTRDVKQLEPLSHGPLIGIDVDVDIACLTF